MIMLKKILVFIKKRAKLIMLLVLILGIVVVLLIKNKPEQPEQVFEHPQVRDISKTLEVSGRVDAKHRARLRFLTGGKIVYLGANEGDWVKKWQTIATIDQRDLQKRLEKSLNLYMQERWDWEETLDNTKDRTLDNSENRSVDQEQWDLDNKVIDVELQDIAVSQSVMSAPFAGILVYQPVNTTNTQVVATDYFEIVDPQSLIFRAEINEEDIALVAVNQSATVKLDAYLDEELPTAISYIAYVSAQTASGNVFYVEFPLVTTQLSDSPNSNISKEQAQQLLNKYRLGLNGDVNIILDSKTKVLTIPLVATKVRENNTFVDIKNDQGLIEEKQIQVGLETDEYVEVTSGLTETDLVLIPSTL